MNEYIIAVSSDLVRAGMYATLTNHKLTVADSVENFQQLREAVKLKPFATVILCSHLAGDGTIETWRRLQKRHPDLQLLLWAKRFQDVLDFQCNLRQVDGYLLESASHHEFIQAVESVGRGQMYVATAVAEYLARNPRRAEQVKLLRNLSDREVQVTQMIGRGIRVAEIAKHLNISSKTVNTFRYRIFAKIGVSGDVELAHVAIQTGLIDLEQLSDHERNPV